MLYNKIVNPENGRRVNVNGPKGLQILMNYIELLQFGGAAFSESSRSHGEVKSEEDSQQNISSICTNYNNDSQAKCNAHGDKCHWGPTNIINSERSQIDRYGIVDPERLRNRLPSICMPKYLQKYTNQTYNSPELETYINITQPVYNSEIDNFILFANSRTKNFLDWLWDTEFNKSTDGIIPVVTEGTVPSKDLSEQIYKSPEFQLVNDRMLNHILPQVE